MLCTFLLLHIETVETIVTVRSKRFFGASCTAQKMADTRAIESIRFENEFRFIH